MDGRNEKGMGQLNHVYRTDSRFPLLRLQASNEFNVKSHLVVRYNKDGRL